MWILALIVGYFVWKILCAIDRTAEETREFHASFLESQRPPKSAEESYRDWFCDPDPLKQPVRTLAEATKEHLKVCKLPGCKGLHRSHP
jgi:hypothetical protein